MEIDILTTFIIYHPLDDESDDEDINSTSFEVRVTIERCRIYWLMIGHHRRYWHCCQMRLQAEYLTQLA